MGLNSADFTAYEAVLGQSHQIRRTVHILDLDHAFIEDVSPFVVSGQVNVGSGEVGRSATLTLFDPTHSIGFDTANPTEGTVAPKYLVRITRGIYVETIDRWVDVPLGVLWANKVTRSGDVLSIEAQGKEALGQYPYTYPASLAAPGTMGAGFNKLYLIQAIMGQIGETRFAFTQAESAAVTTAARVVTPEDTWWGLCREIADSMGWLLFYNAEGYLECRPPTAAAVYTFARGIGGTLRDEGDIGYSTDGIINAVKAEGATPENAEAPFVAFAATAPTDPLSLTRNGVRLYFRTDVSNEWATTQAITQSVADYNLAVSKLQSVTGGVDSSVVAHLEPGDQVGYVNSDGVWVQFAWTEASIPLGLGTQSNGYQRRVSTTSRRLVA